MNLLQATAKLINTCKFDISYQGPELVLGFDPADDLTFIAEIKSKQLVIQRPIKLIVETLNKCLC